MDIDQVHFKLIEQRPHVVNLESIRCRSWKRGATVGFIVPKQLKINAQCIPNGKNEAWRAVFLPSISGQA